MFFILNPYKPLYINRFRVFSSRCSKYMPIYLLFFIIYLFVLDIFFLKIIKYKELLIYLEHLEPILLNLLLLLHLKRFKIPILHLGLILNFCYILNRILIIIRYFYKNPMLFTIYFLINHHAIKPFDHEP